MWLPPKDYGELCHAIRSRFANKIPKDGFLLYKDHFYTYTFDDEEQKIYCIGRKEISGNEQTIDMVIKGVIKWREQ